MKRLMLIIAIVLIFATSCQHQETSYTGAGIETVIENTVQISSSAQVENSADTNIEQDLISSMDNFYKSFRLLKIQKNGEGTIYDAAKPLAYIFADMISKVEVVYPDTPEGHKQIKDFNYNYYDYRLKFEGAKDILFTREGNVFHFEGEEQLYILWGSADSLLDSLIFNAKNNTVDINGEKIRVMSNSYKEDIDNDGEDENIELIYERGRNTDLYGSLIVSINGNEAVVMKDEEWFTMPYHTISQMPEIRFLQERDGNNKLLLVIYSWLTNGIGSTGEIKAYKYVNGHIGEVEVKNEDRIIKYKGDNIVSVDFPALKRNVNLRIDPEKFKKFLKDKNISERQLKVIDTSTPHTLWYIVNDFNGDGQEELCSVSVPDIPPVDYCREYTYYKYEGGELKPVQVFIIPFYTGDEKKSNLMQDIFDLINAEGYLRIGDEGIVYETFQPAYDYTPGEMIETLEELQKDKILKIEGNRVYIDY